MNVNYLRVPAMTDALSALAKGDYFTTTGEVLLPQANLTANNNQLTAKASVNWTYPLRLAEIVWGDGRETHRQTIPLTNTKEFDHRDFTWQINAADWKWARLAVWDIAGNGAFTPPIWR
jgi:hypothetical protein